MPIEERDIEKLAGLAKIELTRGEGKKFADQISSILDYVKEIQSVDTSSIAEIPFHLRIADATRLDVVDQTPDVSASTSQFPARFGSLNKVKPVLGADTHGNR